MKKMIIAILISICTTTYADTVTPEEAQHRLPPVVFSIDIPKVVNANTNYDFKWSVMGYHDDYILIVNVYDKNGKRIASEQANSYKNEAGQYSWGTMKSKRFFYSKTLNFNFTGSQDLMIRFFASPKNDDVDDTFLSCLVPGGLGYEAGDSTGRKIKILGR